MDTMQMEDLVSAGFNAGGAKMDSVGVKGVYHMECFNSDGELLWEMDAENLVTTLGKNLLLDTTLAGSAYTTTGPFMGLITSTSFTAVAIGDTMASHTGWLECNSTNAPAYGATRPTVTFGAASGGVKISTGSAFIFTNSGTVQGAFQVTGGAATATNTATLGTLFNAGTLATPQPVVSTNTLTVTYSLTLT